MRGILTERINCFCSLFEPFKACYGYARQFIHPAHEYAIEVALDHVAFCFSEFIPCLFRGLTIDKGVHEVVQRGECES